MNRTEKDKRDKKLLNFLREWDERSMSTDYSSDFLDELKKKYGFTQDDWHRAVRLRQHVGTHSLFVSGIGYKKGVHMDRERSYEKSERTEAMAPTGE